VRRIGTAFAGLAVLLFLALAVGFGYLAVQVIDAFAAIRDLNYGALEDETLVVVFRNLLWGVSAAAGAAVAVLGVGLAAWRTVTQHRQSRIEQRQVETETFSKAMELLGNEEFAIRLGGILQLETLAQQSRRLHWPIMEAFCAYLREQRPVEGHTPKDETGARPADTSGDRSDSADAAAAFPADLQAIVTAIGRRNRRHDPAATPLPLEGVNLSGASFQGAHLERAVLIGAHLERANLIGAHLERADLFGAHLERALFVQAHLERADLSEAHLEDTNLIGAHLEGADLEEAHLEGANLRETDVTQGQIDMAFGNAETRLPNGLTYPSRWKKETAENRS
jgi:hypothetical protein